MKCILNDGTAWCINRNHIDNLRDCDIEELNSESCVHIILLVVAYFYKLRVNTG